MTETTRLEWAERVREWRSSGLTARQFAASRGFSAQTLYWWSSHLGQAARPTAEFIEVKLSRPSGRIEIIIRDAVRIEVSGEFNPELLRRVVAALEVR